MNRYRPEGELLNTEENLRYISSFEGMLEAMEQGAILEGKALLRTIFNLSFVSNQVFDNPFCPVRAENNHLFEGV